MCVHMCVIVNVCVHVFIVNVCAHMCVIVNVRAHACNSELCAHVCVIVNVCVCTRTHVCNREKWEGYEIFAPFGSVSLLHFVP